MDGERIHGEWRSLNCKKMTIIYLENEERKEKKGSTEEIIEIHKKIHANPKTMKLIVVLHPQAAK